MTSNSLNEFMKNMKMRQILEILTMYKNWCQMMLSTGSRMVVRHEGNGKHVTVFEQI